jgi:hypothetical protein
MKFLYLLPLLVGLSLTAETRFKVGNSRWAFQITTSDGKHIREEYVDEDGISYGKFTFTNGTEKMNDLRYKFNPNGEPDFVFYHGTESEGGEAENKEMMTDFPESNYSSISSKADFAGHVTFKIGNSMYDFNFKTGDKKENREETLSEDGMVVGKYLMMDENEGVRVVRYKFNMTGNKPSFEVSMDKKVGQNQRINLFKPNGSYGNNQLQSNYAVDNRLGRTRVFVPPFRPPMRQIRPVVVGPNGPAGSNGPAGPNGIQLQRASSNNNNAVGKDGNWYYRPQI